MWVWVPFTWPSRGRLFSHNLGLTLSSRKWSCALTNLPTKAGKWLRFRENNMAPVVFSHSKLHSLVTNVYQCHVTSTESPERSQFFMISIQQRLKNPNVWLSYIGTPGFPGPIYGPLTVPDSVHDLHVLSSPNSQPPRGPRAEPKRRGMRHTSWRRRCPSKSPLRRNWTLPSSSSGPTHSTRARRARRSRVVFGPDWVSKSGLCGVEKNSW